MSVLGRWKSKKMIMWSMLGQDEVHGFTYSGAQVSLGTCLVVVVTVLGLHGPTASAHSLVHRLPANGKVGAHGS